MKDASTVVSKLTSARFLLAVGFGATACVAFIMGKLPVEAFVGLCGTVITGYQLRNRPEENGTKNGHA